MRGNEHAVMMLRLAESDLKALRNMGDVNSFDDAIWGFHAQQAVEKLFKAWLGLLGKVYPRTHDLQVLYRLLEQTNAPGIGGYIDLIDLTDYAVQFRYELGEEAEILHRAGILSEIESLGIAVKQFLQ